MRSVVDLLDPVVSPLIARRRRSECAEDRDREDRTLGTLGVETCSSDIGIRRSVAQDRVKIGGRSLPASSPASSSSK